MNWMHIYGDIIKDHSSWIFPVLMLISLVTINKLLVWGISFFEKKDEQEKSGWRNALLSAVKKPLILAFWIYSIVVLMRYYFPIEGKEYTSFYKIILPLQKILLIFLVGWFLLRLIHNVQSHYLKRSIVQGSEIDKTAVDAITKISTVIVFIIIILGTIQVLGISITGLLAFGGAAGIAVGFAAQNLVSNLFGGLTVFASRIFKIGDDIIIKDADLSGKVIHIGWRSTTIESWDGKRVYVPNSVFNTHNLINNSRLTHRTLSQDIFLSFEDYSKIQDVVDEGNKWLSTRNDLSYFVFRFSGFGESALKINIYAWVTSVPSGSFVPYGNFAKSQEEILLALTDIAHRKGCSAIPASHLHINKSNHRSASASPHISMQVPS